jgi:hypothetical protein
MSQDLRYPVGRFNRPDSITPEHIQTWIGHIEAFPNQIQAHTENLSSEQLSWRYRPDGWNIRQVVHHCADSHINAFTRFKLALTEDTPTIKPYLEGRWAEMSDYHEVPIQASLQILEGLHLRWVHLLRRLREEDLKKTFHHPEHNSRITVETNIGLYAWHCRHHLGHVLQALSLKENF